MRNFLYKGRFVFFPLAAALFLTVLSLIVMQLWNNLMPAIFHLGLISFWQAMGLLVLSKLLFGFGGGRRFGGGGAPWMRGRMMEKFKNMTPEEQARFKEKFSHHRCGERRGWSRDWKAGESAENAEKKI